MDKKELKHLTENNFQEDLIMKTIIKIKIFNFSVPVLPNYRSYARALAPQSTGNF